LPHLQGNSEIPNLNKYVLVPDHPVIILVKVEINSIRSQF